jgi:hypothetical protein
MVFHLKNTIRPFLCVAPFGKSLHEENKPCNLYPSAPQIAPRIHFSLKYLKVVVVLDAFVEECELVTNY